WTTMARRWSAHVLGLSHDGAWAGDAVGRGLVADTSLRGGRRGQFTQTPSKLSPSHGGSAPSLGRRDCRRASTPASSGAGASFACVVIFRDSLHVSRVACTTRRGYSPRR